MIDYIRQTYPKTCGQTCIAMLSGKTEQEIINLVGHSRGTKTKEIVTALNTLNIKNSEKLIRISNKNQLPKIAIIKALPVSRKKSIGNWHWVLRYEPKLFDPWSMQQINHLRFISFIKIYEVN